jgi:tRNA (guanine37-N1)-methyltransferase
VSKAVNVLGFAVSETPCLSVPKIYGAKSLALVKKMGLLNQEFGVQREQGHLYVPLTREPTATETNELKRDLPEFEICTRQFFERVEHQSKLVDLLSDRLPPHSLASLPHSIDFVGDIATVELAPELESYKHAIGEAILKAHKKVKTVLAKSGIVSGVYRLRTFDVIGGEVKTVTVHREHGCIFHVDLAKAYFSPRLSYEHNRVASLVRQGETVVDMFAGVGSFSILIAKKHREVQVYAIDVNPDAFQFLKKNVLANRVEASVKPLLGDARQIVTERLRNVADRVIMNLPEKAIEYVDVACKALKPKGGFIHYYEFSDMPEPLENAKRHLTEAVKHADRHLEKISLSRTVRGIAPFTYQVVVDVEIR